MQLGSYELLSAIGAGGTGTVYRGRHLLTGQIVAIKIIAVEDAHPTVLRRFLQECSAILSLQHPHIVQGLEVGEHNGQPWLAMEFIDGQNLAQFVSRRGPLPQADAVRITQQIADALHFAHQHRFVHRDVKPENILLDKSGHVKLADLGLVKCLDAEHSLTHSGTCLGTLAFMPPEQFGDAKHADPRSDVYSLGATLYYALTGVQPFRGGSMAIFGSKLRHEYIPLRQLVPAIRPEIEEVVRRSINPALGQRPQSCRELSELLATAVRGGSVFTNARAAVGVSAATMESEEKREGRRYPTSLSCSCKPVLATGNPWEGKILDISLRGARLQVNRRFEVGTILRVEVQVSPADDSTLWLMEVRWVRQSGFRKWYIGGTFGFSFQGDDLNRFLGNKPVTVVVRLPKASTRVMPRCQTTGGNTAPTT